LALRPPEKKESVGLEELEKMFRTPVPGIPEDLKPAGAEETTPFNEKEAERLVGEILHYAREAASLTKGTRSLGGILSKPEALPLLKAYRTQLKLLRLLGLMEYVLYPVIGVDYLPAEVAKEVLGIDSTDLEFLKNYAIPLAHESEIQVLDPTFLEDLGALRSRIVLAKGSSGEMELWLDKVHQKHRPVTVFLKGFEWLGGPPQYQQSYFLDYIDRFLKPGDTVILWGRSKDLAPFLHRLGYADYFEQAALPEEIRKTLEQANGQLIKAGYPPEPFGTSSGVMIHLAEPFMVLQKPPPTAPSKNPGTTGLEESGFSAQVPDGEPSFLLGQKLARRVKPLAYVWVGLNRADDPQQVAQDPERVRRLSAGLTIEIPIQAPSAKLPADFTLWAHPSLVEQIPADWGVKVRVFPVNLANPEEFMRENVKPQDFILLDRGLYSNELHRDLKALFTRLNRQGLWMDSEELRIMDRSEFAFLLDLLHRAGTPLPSLGLPAEIDGEHHLFIDA